MNVLLVAENVFEKIGGGEIVYQYIIKKNPHVKFYYFVTELKNNIERPENAYPITLRAKGGLRRAGVVSSHPFSSEMLSALRLASSVRESLGPVSFDIVDVPDFRLELPFIRAALERYEIRVGSVVLALHGTISDALRCVWPANVLRPELRRKFNSLEKLSFDLADGRYAISREYAAHRMNDANQEVSILEPLMLAKQMDTQPYQGASSEPPIVAFVGRRERFKGVDIFMDLVWCLPRESYSRALVVGPEVVNEDGIGSSQVLEVMARNRRISYSVIEGKSREELKQLYASRCVVVLPSRHDAFNLVGLEALLLGCPVLISKNAGLASWIVENIPDLVDLIIDPDCSRTAAFRLNEILFNYDEERRRILAAVKALETRATGHDAAEIYRSSSVAKPRAEYIRAELVKDLLRLEETSGGRAAPTASVGLSVYKTILRRAGRKMRSTFPRFISGAIAKQLGRVVNGTVGRAFGIRTERRNAIKGALRWRQLSRRLSRFNERTLEAIDAKLRFLSGSIGRTKVGRVPLFRELARLERLRGNDLLAAVYEIRVMRWSGEDRFGTLPFVTDVLRKSDFSHEAEALTAMYGCNESANARCLEYLNKRNEENKTFKDSDLLTIEDRRSAKKAKVAVIVSLYNAESKLERMLSGLRVQSLAIAGDMEVILIDSASPTDERAVFEKVAAAHPELPLVYARSHGRETIQAAWNRGIKLARADYLCFLGADEGLHPDCLRRLAAFLDADPALDWVMADSIVTEVDENGLFHRDVMVYDRSGYEPGLVQLETCFLSWVGGLYRRSIHERFGFYDSTFRAAGDTEFKGRILTRIKTAHVSECLGVFNNYPEERTTAHPRAEIEDVRAWYLHRTPAGIAYSYDGKPIEDAERLFELCLGYRKSFCGHVSTDFDLAHSVALYLSRRGERPSFAAKALEAANELQFHIRAFDAMEGADASIFAVATHLKALRQLELKHAELFGLKQRPNYDVFNDNRYEQHWWSWSDQ